MAWSKATNQLRGVAGQLTCAADTSDAALVQVATVNTRTV